jgi:uncharacterized membrane protein YphA (DoxX/SURF4 family)
MKAKNMIGWALTGLVGFVFIGSAVNNLSGGEHAAETAKSFGLSFVNFKIIGIVEILSAILFIIPRTSVLGALLLVAYTGGAVASHLEHNQPLIAPLVISSLVWITAVVRIPELSNRILNKL